MKPVEFRCDLAGTVISLPHFWEHTVGSGPRDKLSDSFFNADQIVDLLLSIGMKPFVELSFMP